MSNARTKRVGDEIKKVLSSRLVRGLRDPLPGFVTIRSVSVNRDFTRAEVFFSVIGSDEQKEESNDVLQRARKYLRGEVGREISLRNTPELHFVLDDSGEQAARIHQLLNDANIPAATVDEDDGDDG